MKAFHKASSIILFFPVPPAGKGWEYSYPQILQSLPEQLGALLCSGTCPKHWSDWLCKLLGLEELWDVPELPLPLHFLMHASQGGAGMGITGRFSPCFLLRGMGCSGPEVGVCWMGTSMLLSPLIETAGAGTRLWERLLLTAPQAGGSTEWIKHPRALGKAHSLLCET